MAGKKKIKVPKWMKVGQPVRIMPNWYGVISDFAVSDVRVMVLIKSPKGIWRNQKDASEWLEFAPSMIMKADAQDLLREIDRHVVRVNKMLEELETWKSQMELLPGAEKISTESP